MHQDFIITSTNNIEGETISKYLGVINTNVVVGTNLFSDIGASLTDIFGGTSNSYQGKLKTIYDTSIRNLKVKARNLGANAILGLSIDFDEISGGGKSMFMISVSGTAVNVNFSNDSQIHKNNTSTQIDTISLDVLKTEQIKNQIKHKIENHTPISQEEWYFLQQNPILNFCEALLNYVLLIIEPMLDNNAYIDTVDTFINNVSSYIRATEDEGVVEILYKLLVKNPTEILQILDNNNLFSPQNILNLIQNNEINIAILALDLDKNNYTANDFNLMVEIKESLDKMEDLGEIKASKGFLGKEIQKYICPDGHSHSGDLEYCQEFGCGKDIKGFRKNEVEKIKSFEVKLETLKPLMNNKIKREAVKV